MTVEALLLPGFLVISGPWLLLLLFWTQAASPRRPLLVPEEPDALLDGPGAFFRQVERETEALGFGPAACFRDVSRGGFHAVLPHRDGGVAMVASSGPMGDSLALCGRDSARRLFHVPHAGAALAAGETSALRAHLDAAPALAAGAGPAFDPAAWLERHLAGEVDQAVERGELVGAGEFVRPTFRSYLRGGARGIGGRLRALVSGRRVRSLVEVSAGELLGDGFLTPLPPRKPLPHHRAPSPVLPDDGRPWWEREGRTWWRAVRARAAALLGPAVVPAALSATPGLGAPAFLAWLGYGIWFVASLSRWSNDRALARGLACPTCGSRQRSVADGAGVCGQCGGPVAVPAARLAASPSREEIHGPRGTVARERGWKLLAPFRQIRQAHGLRKARRLERELAPVEMPRREAVPSAGGEGPGTVA